MKDVFLPSSLCRVLGACAVLCLVSACQKNDGGAQQAGMQLSQLGQQAGQKLNQAAGYVGQQVDNARAGTQQSLNGLAKPSIDVDPASLASSARANVAGAASSAGAMLDRAGTGLQDAGHRVQQWASSSAAASAPVNDEHAVEQQMSK